MLQKLKNMNAKVTFSEAIRTTVEVEDEVVPDSEYGYMTPSTDDPRTVSHSIEEPPPPVSDHSLGGIDYYLLSYDDPPFAEDEYH